MEKEKRLVIIPENTNYCYSTNRKWNGSLEYKHCRYYRHYEGIQGYCTRFSCEVYDQVKECDFSVDEGI